jgi:hypothetical protein
VAVVGWGIGNLTERLLQRHRHVIVMLLNSLLCFALLTNVLTHDISPIPSDDGLLIDFDDGHVAGPSNLKDEENIVIFEDLTDSPTRVPTISSKTRKPTNKPSAPIPTQKPTRKILLLFSFFSSILC